jgi:hemerythrin-like domain-containing protein
MEHKPINRNKHIVKLSKDHHFTLLFCWKIRNGLKLEVEPKRIASYVSYFWNHHLQRHFWEEESILFSHLADASVKKAIAQHDDIAGQVKYLINSGNITSNEVSTLADALDNHVGYEERDLFPHLEKVLSGEQLEDIGKRIAAQEDNELKDDYTDEFWIQNDTRLK